MNIFFWRKKSKWKTYLSIALLAVIVSSALIFHIQAPFTFHSLKESYRDVLTYYDSSPYLFTFILFLFYVLSVCFIIPDSFILSITAGILMPLPISMLLITFSETVGALIFFFIVRRAFKDYFQRKEKKLLSGKLGKSFNDNQVYYLLFLRLSHFLPFWVINGIASVLNTRAITFIWTTFVGVLPLSYVLSKGGQGLKKALESDEHLRFFQVIDKPTELILIGLGVLMLLPVALKKYLKIFR